MTNPAEQGAGPGAGDVRVAGPAFARLYAGLRSPRLVLGLGAFCLGIAILAASEAVIRKENAVAGAAAEQHVETLARSLGDQIDAELAAVESTIRVIAAEAQRDGLEVATVRMARMVAARTGKSADFFLLDATGRKIWESREVELYPEIIADHLAAHQRDDWMPHVSPASRGLRSGAWALHISYPVVGRNGGLTGIVVVALNAAQLQRSYLEMSLGSGGELSLLRGDGLLLARVADGAISSGHDLRGTAMVRPSGQQGQRCRSGNMPSPVDGAARISSICVLEDHPLLVGVGINADAAMAGSDVAARRYRIIAVLLVALLAGGTLLMFALLSRQQAAQSALRSSEARFRALNALGSDWYWEADAEYRLQHVSEGFSRMSGYEAETLRGRALWGNPLIMPVGSDWTVHKAMIARCAPFRDLALRMISPQGIVAYCSVSGEPVFGNAGELAGYHGVGNDITAEVILRQRLRMQHDVTRILSQEKDAAQAIRAVLETICRTMEWSWGAHRHLEPSTMLLTCHEYWLAPGVRADAFVEFARQPKKGDPENGTVSKSIMRGEIIWFTDHTPISLRRSTLAREAGLRGAIAIPIRRSSGTGHAMEFFSERVEAPDQVTLDTLESISREVGQFMDRTEAQLASTRLQLERRRLMETLELQLEHMPVACILQDDNFCVVYCNPAAERVFGYSLSELQGLDIASLIVPEHVRHEVWARRNRLQAGDTNVVGTNENIRKDGGRIICEWSNTPLTDETGKFTGVLATAQDVTERVKMVAALEASETRYRQIFAATPLPMWVTDVGTPRFLAVNDATVAKYGYSRDEFQRMTALDLQVEEDRTAMARQLQEMDPLQFARYERRHMSKDGRVMTVEITAQPFQYGGQPARLILAVDVTERKRSQLALEESEARFRAVFEQASVGIAIRELTAQPRLLRVNRKLCEILGYTESELLQKTTTELTDDDDMDSTLEMNRRLMSGTLGSYSRRKRYKRKDGRSIWVNLSVSKLTEGREGEQVGYLISVIEDISEQVQSEARVLESEARYRQIFALTPLPMYLRDDDTLEFIDVNDACLAMYGYSREEMLSMSLIDIQTPENRDRYLGALGRPTGIVERLQKQHLRKGGRPFDVEIYSYPTMLASRRVRLVLARDMTDQLRMERLLRDNEARLRAIADNVPAVIAFFDAALQLQYSNIAFDRWFGGASPDAMAGHDGQGYRDTLEPLLEQALRGSEVATELMLDTKAGSRVARMTLIPHLDDHGLVSGVHLMGYDLTDFRHAEAEVRQLNAELEQRVEQRTRALAAANRELESFSYSVSHDLRAPLRTIDGFSQILLDEYAGKLDATGCGYLERVRAGSQRMAKLIDDLLELARVTRRDLQIRDCDLSALVLDIARELALADASRKVGIKVAPGMIVTADPGLLRIALDNLLRNAWKFTSLKPGAVIEVGQLANAGEPTYFVRDNGVGFDMAYVGKLFGAFQRLHSEAEFQGTGIGLALVQRVIRRHGGNVWAEAAPGLGASFYFTLPSPAAGSAETEGLVRAET